MRRFGSRVTILERAPQLASHADADVAEEDLRLFRDDGIKVLLLELDSRGYIRVDEKLQTTAPGIWAMGDCAGCPHFTHVAFDDFRAVRDNLNGGKRTIKDRLVPFCIFTDRNWLV